MTDPTLQIEFQEHQWDLVKREFNLLPTIIYCLLHYLPKTYTAELNGEIGAVVSGVGVTKRNGGTNGSTNRSYFYGTS